MKRYFTFLALLAATYFSYSQQIEIDNTYTPEELIENVLFQGCIEVSNVVSTVNGNVNNISSYGYFENSDSNFPFDEGIILATGDVMDAGNPLNTDPLNQGETSWGTDDDLENILGVSNTLNATVIEFDFIAATNEINLNYILASEEYLNDFPCNYSDSFAFLIKPNDNSEPYTNITLVPGTTTNVSTQNIRPEIVGFCEALNEEYFEGFNVGDTNYNGRTKVLTANANITPNTSYHIKLMIADQFDENFDSAVFLQGNTYVSDIAWNTAISTCQNTTTLDTGIENPEATFTWSLDNNELTNTSPSLTVTESGIYHVNVGIPYNNSICTIEATVAVSLNAIQDSNPMTDYALCEEEATPGTTTFDLTVKNSEALASTEIENASVHYYLTQEDAENNSNAITEAIQNTENPQTIYVRIANETTGCIAYNSFLLITNELPELTEGITLYKCDEGNDEVEVFNLNEISLLQTSEQENINYTYYFSSAAAQDQVNNLPISYTNTTSPQTIYIRAENMVTGCVNYGEATLELKEKPTPTNTTSIINACTLDEVEFAEFDLTTEVDNFIEDPENYTISYYLTEQDANDATNAIEDPENYTNNESYFETVYVRIEDPDTGCYEIVTLDIYTSILLTESNLDTYAICDDESNDEVETFDLNAVEIYIQNNIEGDPEVVLYETASDQEQGINALDTSIPFENTSNPQAIYVTLSIDECEVEDDILLQVNPYFAATILENQTICDEDDNGTTIINTAQFDDVIDPEDQYTFQYYLSEAEAITETNNINSFVNTQNPQTVWVNISNNGGECSAISSFDILVSAAPTTQTPPAMVICDDDNDGTYTVNLHNSIPDVIEDTGNIDITFHSNYADAEANSNSIENSTAYTTNSTSVFIRLTNATTGCYSIEMLDVMIVYFPELTNNNTLELCETDGDNTEMFLLANFDPIIVQEQSYIQTSYFETETDAINNTNSIDKNSDYANTQNPQQIFVRRESPTDATCFAIDQVTLLVNSYPVFEAPEDLFLCDDISNDGIEIFDLTDALSNLDPSYQITFYSSLSDLYNEENALDTTFENTTNPQTIYTKVNSSEGCYETTSFDVNVVQVAEVNQPDPLFICDEDDNGYEIVDLTDEDIEVLMIRQYDVTIAYYESEADASSQTNAIAFPESYQVAVTNSDQPTTIYIVVTNNTSGCSLTVPLDIWISGLPSFTDNYNITICQNSTTILVPSNIAPLDIVTSSENIALSYFTTFNNANTNTNPIVDSITIDDNENNVIWVRAENTITGCFNIKEIAVSVYMLPNINTPEDMHICTFAESQQVNLTSQNSSILGNLNVNNFEVKYYLSEEEALLNINEISNPEAYEAYDEEIIYVAVENENTLCVNTTAFQIFLEPFPESGADTDYVLCYDDLPLIIDAYTGNDTDTYQWYNNSTSSQIEVMQPGVYHVTITSEHGCSTTQYIGVTASEAASITNIDVVSFSENNSITVTVTGNGNYLFVLDNGTPQTSNIFENVLIGYHTITVIDQNGCTETIATDIVVLGFPKYFTPNGDGVNDSWNVFGFDTLKNSYVAIFDRYGKLLKVLHPEDDGWDGTYNGNLMPSNDYWFKAFIYDVDEPFEQTGHFSLKR